MGITIPKNHRRVEFETKEKNPVIVPCRVKNYLTPTNGNDIVALDAAIEPQLYRKTILVR